MKLTNQKKFVNIILTLLIFSILSIVNPKILITNDIAKIDYENEMTPGEGLNNLNQQNLISNNLLIEPAQQDVEVIFVDLSIINIINDTTKLIDKVNITLDLNVTKYTTLIILEYTFWVDGKWGFNDIEQYYNPSQGLNSYSYVIEGWKLYESYAQGTANVTFSQLGPDTSISKVFNFNYIDFSPPPVIKILGTEMIIPYVNHTAIYNSNFGTENSTFIDCECVDYFEFRFEISVLIPGNISTFGTLQSANFAIYLFSLQIDHLKYYSIGNHNISYFFDATQIYNSRNSEDQFVANAHLSTYWVLANSSINSHWTTYRIPILEVPFSFNTREFSPMTLQLFESSVNIEYLDINQTSSIDTIKLNIQVYVAEEIEVYHVGYFVQHYQNNGYSQYYRQGEFHEFGYTNYTKSWNSFSVSLPTESLSNVNLEGWQDGSAPIFFALSASWNQNITVNSEIIETNYWLNSYPHEIDIDMFPELQSLITSDLTSHIIDSSTSVSTTSKAQNDLTEETKFFSAGLLFFTPLWFILIISSRKLVNKL